MIQECSELSSNKIISVSENKRKFTIQNHSNYKINKVIVDDCLIKNGKKCDYLFEILPKEDVEKVFYVELKGSHIKEAIEQLETTIKFCQKIHKNLDKNSFIVASKVPKSRTDTQNIKREFKKKNNHLLKISTFSHIETI